MMGGTHAYEKLILGLDTANRFRFIYWTPNEVLSMFDFIIWCHHLCQQSILQTGIEQTLAEIPNCG